MRPYAIILAAFWGLMAVAHPQTIVIDPGHISEVGPGTRGKQITELRVAWEVALLLEKRLKRDGYRVVMTKTREREVVTNQRRAEIGNRARADLMVRLHCDAHSGSGFSTFYPTTPGTVRGVRGPRPDVLRRTAPIARRFHSALARELKGALPDLGLRSDRQTAIGRRQGALTGSIFSEVPAVLVEMVVLTNPRDERWILVPANRQRMADALAAGVRAAVPRR